MFIGRRADRSIYGTWTVRQFEGQEELPDDHPEVLAGPVPLPPQTPSEIRMALDKAERDALKGSGLFMAFVDMTPAQIDAWIDANVQSLADARSALKLLAKIVNVAVRRQMR